MSIKDYLKSKKNILLVATLMGVTNNSANQINREQNKDKEIFQTTQSVHMKETPQKLDPTTFAYPSNNIPTDKAPETIQAPTDVRQKIDIPQTVPDKPYAEAVQSLNSQEFTIPASAPDIAAPSVDDIGNDLEDQKIEFGETCADFLKSPLASKPLEELNDADIKSRLSEAMDVNLDKWVMIDIGNTLNHIQSASKDALKMANVLDTAVDNQNKGMNSKDNLNIAKSALKDIKRHSQKNSDMQNIIKETTTSMQLYSIGLNLANKYENEALNPESKTEIADYINKITDIAKPYAKDNDKQQDKEDKEFKTASKNEPSLSQYDKMLIKSGRSQPQTSPQVQQAKKTYTNVSQQAFSSQKTAKEL